MQAYATLERFKQYLRGSDSQPTPMGENEDQILRWMLAAASRTIEEYTRRTTYVPIRKTIRHDYPRRGGVPIGVYDANINIALPDQGVDGNRLRLLEPLLELEAVLNGDGETIDVDDLHLRPTGVYPKRSLYIKGGVSFSWAADSSGDTEGVIPITGVWGYHENYEEAAYVDSLDVVGNNPLASGDVEIEVADVVGFAEDFEAPKFQVGHMLRLADGSDYEFMLVMSVNAGDNKLTVKRAYRGTVAQEWAQGTAIQIFRPMEGVAQGCLEIAKLVYRRRDRDAGDIATILGTGIRIEPKTLPEYVTDMLPTPDTSYVFA